jgi:HEAT repeat protein
MGRLVGAAAVLYLVMAGASGAGQTSFDQVIRGLASPDPAARLKAVRLLKDGAYPEAAEPLAALLSDPDDAVQAEAIAAELNIFLAQRVVSRKRVGFVFEVRTKISASAAFEAGPLALGSRPVPAAVLTGLRAAARDANPQIGLEALYALGTLGVEPGGSARRELLRTSGPDLAAMIGSSSAAFRTAAVRVIGRLYTMRPGDPPIEQAVGDAVITALNDRDRAVRVAAMESLGAMRYERAIQALADLFRYHQHGEAAEAALDAIARIGHSSSAPLFVSVLEGKDAAQKAIAIEAFARIGDRAQQVAIDAALTGERRESVLLAGNFASVVLANGSIDPLTEALRRSRVRTQALRYLVEIAPGRAVMFARHAEDPDARLRADVADILGLANDRTALPIVERMLDDSDPEVALAAERAVARLHAL